MKKYIYLIFLIFPLFLPNIASAVLNLNLDYPSFGGYDIDCKNLPADGSIKCAQDLNQIVAWFYYFIIGIAGLSAFVMLVWGGVQYLTSAGNPTATSDAKDRIKSALLGLLLILTSWLILQVINPDLTTLKLP